MNDNKDLVITSITNIYQSEHQADNFLFLLPQKYGDLNILDCVTTLYWHNENGEGSNSVLNFDSNLYNDLYLQASIPITNTFTQINGNITLWLQIVNGDNIVIIETNEITIPIIKHDNSIATLTSSNLSLLDSLNVKVQQLETQMNSIVSTSDIDTAILSA